MEVYRWEWTMGLLLRSLKHMLESPLEDIRLKRSGNIASPDLGLTTRIDMCELGVGIWNREVYILGEIIRSG